MANQKKKMYEDKKKLKFLMKIAILTKFMISWKSSSQKVLRRR